jgi:hypothetical protein
MELTSAPLTSFLTALGVGGAVMERPGLMTVSADIRGHAAKDLAYTTVKQLVDAYGPALLTADVRLEDYTEIHIKPGITAPQLDAQKANIVGDTDYMLELRIDKDMLLKHVLGPEATRCNVHYFLAASVVDLLARGLDEAEPAIWGDATGVRRLLVGDTDLLRSGPVLNVVGGAHLSDGLPPVPPLPEDIATSIDRMRAGREQHISWDHQWVQRLTPVHLQLDGEPGNSELEKLLASAYIQLCLLYTCDRARRRPSTLGGWEARAEYRGGQLAVPVPLREAEPIGAPVTNVMVSGFAGFVDWCYRLRDEGTTRDWATDRLQFVQVRIAQVLEPVPEAERLVTLVNSIVDVLGALDGQWRAFIEDRLGQYLEQERQLETLVNDVVRKFGERSAALTKSLSDTLLAAIAALIGSAIAAAFKTPFNSGLFRVGMLAYAGYVLIFPGSYGLGSQVGQYIDESRAFEHDKRRFQMLLGPVRVNAIVSDRITKAGTRYWCWFGLTVEGYVLAIAAAIVAAVVVPWIVA